jgi:hypothetical protein
MDGGIYGASIILEKSNEKLLFYPCPHTKGSLMGFGNSARLIDRFYREQGFTSPQLSDMIKQRKKKW